MKRRRCLTALCAGVILALGVAVSVARHPNQFALGQCQLAGRSARMRPDYGGTVIPPTIAPLNFVVDEPGTLYRVEMHAQRGEPITVRSASPEIIIPRGPWKALLEANRGGELIWDIFVRSQQGVWTQFAAATNRIAQEDIDPYLVYRVIGPAYNWWKTVGVYQRRLTDYDESTVALSTHISVGCLNCHAFCSHRPDRMTLAVRGTPHGAVTLQAKDGAVEKLEAATGYPAWHPSGSMIAFSLNRVQQFFHAAGLEVRDVVDLDSDLVCLDAGSHTMKTAPAIADPDRLETYPTWSPDGRWLYFCSAAIPWEDRERVPPKDYDKVRYDLRRIRYDIETDAWGEPETVLSAQDTGLSILLPRISPDGRYLLFCMCQYGCFPIYQPSSDLYMMDLQARRYERLEINSPQSESWHSWSSNGRWFAFSSKRRDGLFTRIYLSYFDPKGKAHKPILLPQKDPTFYDSFLRTHTVPEFITGPVTVTPSSLIAAIRSPRKIPVRMPDISMTRQTGPESPWRQPAAHQDTRGR